MQITIYLKENNVLSDMLVIPYLAKLDNPDMIVASKEYTKSVDFSLTETNSHKVRAILSLQEFSALNIFTLS